MKSLFLWGLRILGIACLCVSALILYRFMPILTLENQLPERVQTYLRLTKNTLPRQLEESITSHLPSIYQHNNIAAYEYAELSNNDYIGVLEFINDSERVVFEEAYLLTSTDNIAYQAYKNNIYIASTGSILNELYNDKQPKLWDKDTYKQLRYNIKPSSTLSLWTENKHHFDNKILQNIVSTAYPSTYLIADKYSIKALISTPDKPYTTDDIMPYLQQTRINNDIIRYTGYDMQTDYNTLQQQLKSINSDYQMIYNGLYNALTQAYIGDTYSFESDILPLLNSTYTMYIQPHITNNSYNIALEIPYNEDAKTLLNSINTKLLERDTILQESVIETEIDGQSSRKELIIQEKKAVETVNYKSYTYTKMPKISYYTDNNTLLISNNSRFLETLLDTPITQNITINKHTTHITSNTNSAFEALSLLFPPSYNALTHSYNTSILAGLYDYLLQNKGVIEITSTPKNGYNVMDIGINDVDK